MANAKTQVVKKETGATAVVSWKDKLSGYAQEASDMANEAGGAGGKFISAKKGKLYYDGQPVAGNALDVIIVAQTFENCYYDVEYDPDNPRSPVCFSFGGREAEMVPHEKSAKPQHGQCKGCEWNEFGSADKGKGKACKNIMRLALLPAAPLDGEALGKAEVAYMKLPVTSVKGAANYIRSLRARFELPPFAVVTRLGCIDDDKTQFKITFEDVARLDGDDEVMQALITRHEEQTEAITFPYQPPAEEEVKPKGKTTGRAKKY